MTDSTVFWEVQLAGPILPFLTRNEVEPDQRVRDALAMVASTAGLATTIALVGAFRKLNTRGMEALPTAAIPFMWFEGRQPTINEVEAMVPVAVSVKRAILRDPSRKTLGASQLLHEMFALELEHPNAVSALGWLIRRHLGYSDAAHLSNAPRLSRLLGILRAAVIGADDYQYLVALEGNHICFRVVSTLGSYVQRNDSGLLVPERVLLTHMERFGFFVRDVIEELESLVNSSRSTECDFQRFFESHPQFLRKWDHREVYPHVCLVHKDAGELVPDFILTNVEAQDAAIVELKRPQAKVVRHQDNRIRFANVVMEAKAQLLTYRRWFEVPENRCMLRSIVGMEMYEPRLIVIIGRASEFRSEIERAALRADNPEMEVATYDDLLRFAKDRQAVIHGR